MESRLQEAVEFKLSNPDAAVAFVAREFKVSRYSLMRRLNGAGPKKGRPAPHSRLTGLEKVAIYRYIDRLERINLAVRREFITNAVNAILREQDRPSDFIPVGPAWTSRFLRRHRYIITR